MIAAHCIAEEIIELTGLALARLIPARRISCTLVVSVNEILVAVHCFESKPT